MDATSPISQTRLGNSCQDDTLSANEDIYIYSCGVLIHLRTHTVPVEIFTPA